MKTNGLIYKLNEYLLHYATLSLFLATAALIALTELLSTNRKEPLWFARKSSGLNNVIFVIGVCMACSQVLGKYFWHIYI